MYFLRILFLIISGFTSLIFSQGVKKEDSYIREANLYLLGPKDVINVIIYGEPQLSGDYELNEEGKIKFPILGNVELKGLTIQQAAEKIEKLLEKDYFVDAQVSVYVKEYKSFWVNVIGEVKSTGRKYLKSKATVLDVISECGGLTQEAGEDITIQRPLVEEGNGVTKIYKFTIKDLTDPNSNFFNFQVRTGDTIVVHSKPYFYIQGEVQKPGKYELVKDLTLLQAIAIAGGVGKFANEKNIEIYRTEGSETKVIRKNLKEIRKNEEEDILIMPMDTIIVNKRTF